MSESGLEKLVERYIVELMQNQGFYVMPPKYCAVDHAIIIDRTSSVLTMSGVEFYQSTGAICVREIPND